MSEESGKATLDEAVRSAFGTDFDLDLQHDWHKTVTHRITKSGRRVEKTTWRFTISEEAREEVLRRLLELNHQRYREEVEAGLHEPKKASSRKRRKSGGSGRRRRKGGGGAGLFD